MVAGPDQTDKAESGKLCEVCKASSQRNRATAENPISCQAMAACWSRSFPVEQGNVPCGNFSRYIEVVNLTTITTAHVKDKFKSIFTSLLSKGEDAHKSLMVYRATPSSHGSSLAQLLMGWNIRKPVPVSQEKLQPRWPDLQASKRKDQGRRSKNLGWTKDTKWRKDKNSDQDKQFGWKTQNRLEPSEAWHRAKVLQHRPTLW